MPEPDNGFLLKVLSGVQYGVEVALDEGTYSFGSGADADVQIVDVTLAPIHGHLRIRGGKVALRSDGGEIATSSGLTLPPGQAEWSEIAQLDIVTAGTTRFAVGGRGAKWGALAREGAPGAAPGGANPRAAGRSPRRGLGLAAAGVLAAAGLTAAGLYLGGGGGPMLIAAPAEEMAPVEVVRSALAALPFAHTVTARAEVDGTLDAEGYVQSVVERRAVLNALNDTGLQVRRRIWVRDIIENEVAELIRSQGLVVEQRLSPDGVLTLGGTVLDPAQAERLVALIRGEVFGLTGVDDQIRTTEHYLAEVRGVLEAARLRDRVILRLDGLLIEATGVVTNDQIDSWVGFIQVYSRRYAPILPLRSFVTLEAAGGEVGAPIVIGDADPGQGRAVPVEALATDSVLQPRDIFALPDTALAPPPATPNPEGEAPAAAADPVVGETARNAVVLAAQTLLARRPDLAERIMADQAAGLSPDMELIQLALGEVGGRMILRAGPGGIEPLFLLPGSDVPLSYAEIAAALREAPAPPPPDEAAVVGAAIEADPQGLLLRLLRAPAAAPPPGEEGSPSLATPEVEAVVGPDTAAAGAAAPILAGAVDPAPEPTQAQAPRFGAYEAVRTESQLNLAVERLVAAANRLIEMQGAADGPLVVFPSSDDGGETLRDMAILQNEALAAGATLLPGPNPLGAAATEAPRAGTCWPGARVQINALPTVLFWLDILSLNVDLDMAELDPLVQGLLMEAALSPDRLTECLIGVGNAFALRLAAQSTFLSESARNRDFGQFLFRNVPVFDLALTGVNLTGERFIQPPDGRRLRVGMAPTLNSRLAVIGDLGALFRVENGYQVLLYPASLSWRIAAN